MFKSISKILGVLITIIIILLPIYIFNIMRGNPNEEVKPSIMIVDTPSIDNKNTTINLLEGDLDRDLFERKM